MRGAMVILILLLNTVPVTYATDYTVGDRAEWSTGVDYEKWVFGKSFVVGDNLIFKYTPIHGVIQVNKHDYDSCTINNSLKSYSGGNNTVPLDNAGTLFFLCPTSCYPHAQPMKLTVKIAASTSPARGNETAGSIGYGSGLLLGVCLMVGTLLSLMD